MRFQAKKKQSVIISRKDNFFGVTGNLSIVYTSAYFKLLAKICSRPFSCQFWVKALPTFPPRRPSFKHFRTFLSSRRHSERVQMVEFHTQTHEKKAFGVCSVGSDELSYSYATADWFPRGVDFSRALLRPAHLFRVLAGPVASEMHHFLSVQVHYTHAVFFVIERILQCLKKRDIYRCMILVQCYLWMSKIVIMIIW